VRMHNSSGPGILHSFPHGFHTTPLITSILNRNWQFHGIALRTLFLECGLVPSFVVIVRLLCVEQDVSFRSGHRLFLRTSHSAVIEVVPVTVVSSIGSVMSGANPVQRDSTRRSGELQAMHEARLTLTLILKKETHMVARHLLDFECQTSVKQPSVFLFTTFLEGTPQDASTN